MKRIFILCLIANPASAQLIWEKPVQEFHPAYGETNMVAHYTFKNEGREPVLIMAVESSCGCTKVSSDKTVYEPGEKGEVMANFIFGERTGKQDKTILVKFTEPKESTAVLKLCVHIPEILQITPSMVLWKMGETNALKTIHLQAAQGAMLRVVGVKSSDSSIRVKLFTAKEGSAYNVEVTPADTSKAATAVLQIETDLPGPKRNIFQAYVLIRPEAVSDDAMIPTQE